MRSRELLIVFAIAVTALFLIANRAAYKSFFTDDDFDNMVNARETPLPAFAAALASPGLSGNGNFRAAAYLYYYFLTRFAGLEYARYVVWIHFLHLLNLLLL